MKVAVIGSASSAIGFKALGVDTYVVARAGEARVAWESLDPGAYAVIFLTEDLAEELSEEIERYRHLTRPVVTVIPPVSGGKGYSMERLKELVEKAVGTDMLLTG